MGSLYDRLGGNEGIIKIANDVVDFHAKNARIAPRFAGHDLPALKKRRRTFSLRGLGA
ncbi:MAG: Bacterial-like globin [Nitrospirota bacterium]|jgi:hemoglobin